MIAEDIPGAKSLYGGLVENLEDNTDLLKSIDDQESIRKNQKIIDTLCITIFPPASTKNETLYAVTHPFGLQSIYASTPFKKLFINPENDLIQIHDDNAHEKISTSSLSLAYNLLLRKFYSISSTDYVAFIYSFNVPGSGLKKMEMKLDARFIDVKKLDPDYTLPDKSNFLNTLTTEDLKKILPLDNFLFEGVTIIDVSDVTEREIISEIKTDLLTINSFSEAVVYDKLQLHIQMLIGLKNIRIGITPFLNVSNYYLFSEVHAKNSLLFKNPRAIKQKDHVNEYCREFFKENNLPVFFKELAEDNIREMDYLQYYYEQGVRSLIACPLKNNTGLLGLLEIVANEPGVLKPEHLTMIEEIIPLFTLALEKSQENLEAEIDRKIKENFTAIQSAVEWKFTEAAFTYIQQKQFNRNVKLPSIKFDDVYPLYGAVDIRNSSLEGSNSIQSDLIDQLKMVKTVARKIKNPGQIPQLTEITNKTEKYIEMEPAKWTADDDLTIHAFLQEEIYSFFFQLKQKMPELAPEIEEYFQVLDPEKKMVYNASKRYDESIDEINNTLSYLVDQEQSSAQKIFPHYFESYMTDGIEFNIYIGQSIAPQYEFDEKYIRDLKEWQLTLLVKAACITNGLEKKLSLPLQTTQLILAHSTPISISFRVAERKFDVDGAYNMRYDILKKRIDKVHIKDSDERLTKPGTVAIVFSQSKEADEYMEHIKLLQNQKLLKPGVEQFELEELQGVSGLKALRVNVNFENQDLSNTTVQLSETNPGKLVENK